MKVNIRRAVGGDVLDDADMEYEDVERLGSDDGVSFVVQNETYYIAKVTYHGREQGTIWVRDRP